MIKLSYNELLKEKEISDSIFYNCDFKFLVPKYKIEKIYYYDNNLFNSYRIFDIKHDQIFDTLYDKNNEFAGNIEYKIENGQFILKQFDCDKKYKNYFQDFVYNMFFRRGYEIYDKFTYLLYTNQDGFFEQFYINKSDFDFYICFHVHENYIWVYSEKNYVIFPKFNKRIVNKSGKIKWFDYIENY